MLTGRWTCRRCYAANNPSDESCTSCAWPRVPGSAPLPDDAQPNTAQPNTAQPNGPWPSQPEPWAQPQPWAQPAPPPSPWWTSVLQYWWIIIPIGVIGFGLLGQARRDDGGEIVGGGNLDVYALSVGDCYDTSSGEDVIESVEAGPCTEPHEYEVISIVTFPAQRGTDYPGDDAVIAHAETECVRAFEEYVGISYESSAYYLSFMSPTEEGWRGGDHETVCSGFNPDDPTLEQSMRGARR